MNDYRFALTGLARGATFSRAESTAFQAAVVQDVLPTHAFREPRMRWHRLGMEGLKRPVTQDKCT
jgi:hypothetical protein